MTELQTCAVEPLGTRFTGKERDAETGLDYFGARYFSGAQGRFTSSDQPFIDQYPEDPQSWNLYSYVRNNPLKYTDPNGEDCVYTNNFSTNGTVTVETGNCSQSGGTFVNGTIDTKSLIYDARTNSLGYTYTNAVEGAGGAGAIGLPATPADQLRPEVAGALREAGLRAGRDISTGAILIGGFATSYLSTYVMPAVIAGLTAMGEAGAITIGSKILDGTKTVDSFLSGTLKRSPSYSSNYNSKTLSEVERLVKGGDQTAAKMIKLVKQGARLQEKAGGKQ